MYLGIEVGSTRIKGVVLNQIHEIVASGSYKWQTEFLNGYWTYALDNLWIGVRQVIAQIGGVVNLASIQSLGVSAMMHGFLAFDRDDQLLTPFRTWKNTNTERAANELSAMFRFNIPLRWSIAHYYQAYLDHEAYVGDIAYFTTLAGYVHRCLTGRHVLGIGDASGMFPIVAHDYSQPMLDWFFGKTRTDLRTLLPKIIQVGDDAGTLTLNGAKLIDNSSLLKVGIPLSPPEGDAQTGMVATNSIVPKTGNISAGTSVFAMIVLEQGISSYYPQIDIVQTPLGDAVAMVHANECTSLIDPWIELFGEAAKRFGAKVSRDEFFRDLYESALEDSSPLGHFMREKLVEAAIGLKEGFDILTKKEKVAIEYLNGHGGYFKSGNAGVVIMGETLGIPIRLLAHAGEGGPWGTAILAAYRHHRMTGTTPFEEFLREYFSCEKN